MPPAILLLAATLASADAPTPPPDTAVSDAGELQGQWEVVSVFYGNADSTNLFNGDRWVFAGTSAIFIETKRGPGSRTGVRADPTAGTPTIDRERPDGSINRGIYRRIGDVLVWAQGPEGGRRPASFAPGNAVYLWTLGRVKK